MRSGPSRKATTSPYVVFEPAHKAQHIAGKGQQMGPGKAGPGARRQRCGDHTQSFCGGAAPRQRAVQERLVAIMPVTVRLQ